jgi:hypothetical protein
MPRRPAARILLAFAAVLAGAATARASTISIGAGQTYTTLVDGYTAASNGDTLLIYDGIYAGGLTVGKNLTFQAVNIGGVIVDGGNAAFGAVFQLAADATFIGLTIRNGSRGFFQRDASVHGVIENSVIYGVSTGVSIDNSGGVGGSFDVIQTTFSGFISAININDGGTINVTNSILSNGMFAYLAADFVAINPDHNLLFNIGTVSAINPVGQLGVISSDPAQLVGNPLFVNSTAFDFRLATGSPAIDSGRVTGLAFQGAAPDRGAFESTVVPEPSSLTLLSFGALLGSSGYWWRRSYGTATSRASQSAQ